MKSLIVIYAVKIVVNGPFPRVEHINEGKRPADGDTIQISLPLQIERAKNLPWIILHVGAEMLRRIATITELRLREYL
jgi:hypothetical protein